MRRTPTTQQQQNPKQPDEKRAKGLNRHGSCCSGSHRATEEKDAPWTVLSGSSHSPPWPGPALLPSLPATCPPPVTLVGEGGYQPWDQSRSQQNQEAPSLPPHGTPTTWEVASSRSNETRLWDLWGQQMLTGDFSAWPPSSGEAPGAGGERRLPILSNSEQVGFSLHRGRVGVGCLFWKPASKLSVLCYLP